MISAIAATTPVQPLPLVGAAFVPQFTAAAAVLALGGVISLAAVCLYLYLRKHQRYCGWWFASYLCYALHLAFALLWKGLPQGRDSWLAAICLGLSGAFMLGAGMELSNKGRRDARYAVLGALGLGVCTAACQLFLLGIRSPIGPAQAFLGLSQAATAVLYVRRSGFNRTTKLVVLAATIWSAQHYLLAWFPLWLATFSVDFYLSAFLAMLMVLGLIIEQRYALSEQTYRAILEAIDEAVFIVDLWTFRVVDANQVAHRLAQSPVDELIGLNFLEFCPRLRDDLEKETEPRRRFANVFKPHNRFHVLRADGSELPCEGDASLVDWYGKPAMQVRVRELADSEKLAQLSRRAEKVAALGQLVAGVAHELNNPLAVVLARAQLLVKRLSGDERDELSKILHECERATKIVRELLTYARPCQPQLQPVDINQLVDTQVEMQEAEFLARNIKVEKRLFTGLPLTRADEVQIEQVITNLISNAVYAMSTQQRSRKLTISTEDNGQCIRIGVADTGPGIPKDIVSKIFDPFFTTKPPGKGTGLGLSICNSIAEQHHGKLWVESSPGKGAAFYVEIPILPCTATQPVARPDRHKGAPAHASRRCSVLVVDDEVGIREVLQLILEELGHTVDLAADGAAGLEMIFSKPYDVILCDLRMPTIDGKALFKRVREKDAGVASRIVFLTGDTVNPEARTFLEDAGCRWIAKPFAVEAIEKLINDVSNQLPVAARPRDTAPGGLSSAPAQLDPSVPEKLQKKKTSVSPRRRLLVADDEPEMREILQAILEGMGHIVDTASDGVEAKERLSSGHYDLILSDLRMPNMSGQELYSAVCDDNPELADRFIFVTADGANQQSADFLKRSGRCWLRKPFGVNDLENIVCSVLTQHA